MYYTSEAYLESRFDTTYRRFTCSCETQLEYDSWKAAFRRELADLLGFTRMIPCDAKPEVLGVEDMGDYTRTKMIIQTEPGIVMPFYVLKPKDAGDKPLPAVIAAHGHASCGKNAVCDIDNGNAEFRKNIDDHHYAYGVELVKKGLLVFAPDARGFGERREKYQQSNDDTAAKMYACSCTYLNVLSNPLGMCVTGMWTWDLMRLVDYIQTRPDARADRIGACGLSGGGLQTLWLSAMDERICCSIISGYFYGYKQSLMEAHHCSCNYIPRLYELADIGDVGALLASRPVAIETGDKDGLNGRDGLGNVYPQVEKVRRAAAALGAPENVLHHVFSGQHLWCGEKTVPWMVNCLFA